LGLELAPQPAESDRQGWDSQGPGISFPAAPAGAGLAMMELGLVAADKSQCLPMKA
jgi:hypothetical protein